MKGKEKACADFDRIQLKICKHKRESAKTGTTAKHLPFHLFPVFRQAFRLPNKSILCTRLISLAGQSRHSRMKWHLISKNTHSKILRATPTC